MKTSKGRQALKLLVLSIVVLGIGFWSFINFAIFPNIIRKLDQAAEAKNMDDFKNSLAELSIYTHILPHRKPYLALFGAQLEFMYMREKNISDKKGTLFYVQGLKSRIQNEMNGSWLGIKSEDVIRRGTVLLSIISGFEMSELQSAIKDVQKDAIIYQAKEQARAYETAAQEFGSKLPVNKESKKENVEPKLNK